MQANIIQKALKSLNLTEKESKIYLFLLENPGKSIQEISKETYINRTFCYEIIKNLLQKGLITSANKLRGQIFFATEPDNLILLLKEKEEIVKKAIPELKKIKISNINIPKLKTFQGISGIKALMSELLTDNNELLGIANKKIVEMFEYYLPNFAKERSKRNINIKLIMKKDKWTKEWISKFNDKKELRNFKFVENEKDYESTIYVCCDKVAIINLNEKKPIGILIDDNSYSQTQKIIFNQIWNN